MYLSLNTSVLRHRMGIHSILKHSSLNMNCDLEHFNNIKYLEPSSASESVQFL